MSKIVRAIDVGYGTSTVITDMDGASFKTRTFPSHANSLDKEQADLAGGAFSETRNVIIQHEGTQYEVGEDSLITSDPKASRVLNSGYIRSAQYMAIVKASLDMMELPGNEVDLLVCSLPVSNMHQKEELKELLKTKHHINNGKYITVKDVWIIAQPIGGLLAYFKQQGKNEVSKLIQESILVVDVGYLTVDFSVVTRLIVAEKRSGAIDLGMRKVLEGVSEELSKTFKVKVNVNAIDDAFCKNPHELTMFGKSYSFPICDGLDVHKNKTDIKYDVTPVIERVCKQAIDSIFNVVGDGQDISRVVLLGGPAPVYLDALKEKYPNHHIDIVRGHVKAVAVGSQFGGLEKVAAQNNKVA